MSLASPRTPVTTGVRRARLEARVEQIKRKYQPKRGWALRGDFPGVRLAKPTEDGKVTPIKGKANEP